MLLKIIKNARVAVFTAAVFISALYFVLNTPQAVSESGSYKDDSSVSGQAIADSAPVVIRPQNSTTAVSTAAPAESQPEPSVLADQYYDLSASKAGVYTGPGDIGGHRSFENWLGKPVPYTTDYIDYKGGWTKDFIDSNIWLMKPWGKWAGQTGGRLVLGVPMLENSNAGQFSQGASGAFDTYFQALANELVANGLGGSIIRLGYEGNCNTIGPWQATDNPAGYRLLFRHIVSVMRSVPGSNLVFDWTVCNGLQNGHALTSFSSFYPGDDVVDIIGMDIYDVKWADTAATPQTRWNYLLSRQLGVNELLAFAGAHSKALSFPEWGLYKPGDSYAGGGDNPYFINKMAGLISSTKPVYQAYFNLNWGGGVLSDFPQGQAEFKRIFGS